MSERIPHLDMLRAVTRHMAATQDLSAVLGSITSALVEHAGAALARVFLYLSDEECETCRTLGPVGVLPSRGERCLHLSACAGVMADIAGPDHLLPLRLPVTPARVALERRPFLSDDLFRDAPEAPEE